MPITKQYLALVHLSITDHISCIKCSRASLRNYKMRIKITATGRPCCILITQLIVGDRDKVHHFYNIVNATHVCPEFCVRTMEPLAHLSHRPRLLDTKCCTLAWHWCYMDALFAAGFMRKFNFIYYVNFWVCFAT